MKHSIIVSTLLGFLVVTSPPVLAAGGEAKIKHQHWHFQGFLGQYDKAAVQRGFQVFQEVCSSCHELKYLAFRNLEEIGFSVAEIKAIAAEYEVDADPNSEGEVLKRPALPADYWPSVYANPEEAAALHGKMPPDLSLIAKAREGGADYLYSLLVGYTKSDDPNWNEAFPGHVIGMAQPLYGDDVTYVDGIKPSLEQEAKDVAEFLMWVAEPNLDKRKRLGIAVMLFTLVFTLFAFLSHRRIAAHVHKEKDPAGPWPLH